VQTDGQRTLWQIASQGSVPSAEMAANKPAIWKFSVSVPAKRRVHAALFFAAGIEQSYYNISDDRFLNQPLRPTRSRGGPISLRRRAGANRAICADREARRGNGQRV